MSHEPSAVHQGVADSPITTATGAHDKAQTVMHGSGDLTLAALTVGEATQAIQGTSFDLESLQSPQSLQSPPVQYVLPAANVLAAPSLHKELEAHEAVDESGTLAEVCVTTAAHDPAPIPEHAVNDTNSRDPVAPPPPPLSVVPPSPRDTTPPPPTPRLTATTGSKGESAAAVQSHPHHFPHISPSLHKSTDGVADTTGATHESKMIFGHHATASASRRRNYATTNALTDYEADLTSRDRAKQKEAVRTLLAEKVKADWTWEWPRPPPDSDSTLEVTPKVVKLAAAEEKEVDEGQWKERDEWLSNASDDGDDPPIPANASLSPSSPSPDSPTAKTSPFRFESPDRVGETIKKTQFDRKRRRQKRLAEEMAWNEGLRCFVGRRDAWTGARRVSRSTLGFSPLKPAVHRASMSSEDGGSSTAIEQEEESDWEDDTEIPIAPPLIPPENAMRASILPSAYNTIYDKVVVQALTPSCPMNLKDVTRSCVQGWKRDGEWPPKATMPTEAAKKKARKLSVASLFGLEKHEKEKEKEKEKDAKKEDVEKSPTSGGIRRSLQKILSLGHGAKDTTVVVHNTNGNGNPKDGPPN